jgi:iron uptake system component EfeO
MKARQAVATLAIAALGLGGAAVIAGCGEDREAGQLDVVEQDTSTTGTGTGATGTGTSTAPVTVDTSATDPQALDAAMSKIAAYARQQTAALVTGTVLLQKAVDSGDIVKAKAAYAASRPYYEAIEPLVALFPELDGKLDAREDDFPKKAQDPTWTGFHPIERQLWHDEKITPRTKVLAAGLVKDSQRLNTLMKKAIVPPNVVIPGMAELVDEVEESKITGEEERYSKLDLPTFLANLEGAQEFYESLSSIVEAKDPDLNAEIEKAFDTAISEVKELQKQDGSFPPYDKLTDEQQREIKQNVEALAEPLARVQGTLGVKS